MSREIPTCLRSTGKYDIEVNGVHGVPVIGLKKIPNLGSVDVGREWYWVSQLCRDLTGMMGWGGGGHRFLGT